MKRKINESPLRNFYNEEDYYQMTAMPTEVNKYSATMKFSQLTKEGKIKKDFIFTVSVNFNEEGNLELSATYNHLKDDNMTEYLGTCGIDKREYDSLTKEDRGNLLCEGAIRFMRKEWDESMD